MPVILICLVLIGWFPLLYRRFSADCKGRVAFRALLWSLFFLFPTFMVAEMTYRLPAPILYPLLVLLLPVPFNICVLWKSIVRGADHDA